MKSNRHNVVASGEWKKVLLKNIGELMEGDTTAVTGVIVKMKTSVPTKRTKHAKATIEVAFDPSMFIGNAVEALGNCKIVPLFIFDDKDIAPMEEEELPNATLQEQDGEQK